MRIWRLQQLGDPAEQLRLVDEEPPRPKPGEVLVDVEAVGLAFPDVLQCRGQYQVKSGPGFTPGGESAGTVAALGDDVEGLDVGQRVVFLGSGGLAEQVTHPAAAVFPVPDGVSAEIGLDTWPVPPLFRLVRELTPLMPTDELYRTLNMGIGMVVVCGAGDVDAVRSAIAEPTWVIGTLVPGDRSVRLVRR